MLQLLFQLPPVGAHVDDIRGLVGLVLVKTHTEGSDENTDDEPLDFSEWTVRDEAGYTYVVSDGFVLEPGSRVMLYSGAGSDGGTALY